MDGNPQKQKDRERSLRATLSSSCFETLQFANTAERGNISSPLSYSIPPCSKQALHEAFSGYGTATNKHTGLGSSIQLGLGSGPVDQAYCVRMVFPFTYRSFILFFP